MQMLYTNTNGQAFTSQKMLAGAYARKNVKFYVHRFGGFGIDAELYENEIDPTKAGINFIVKEDLVDYRSGKKVCDRGVYRISIEDFRRYSQKACLNEKHGFQYFIGAHFCQQVG